jgi:hypothetical protein
MAHFLIARTKKFDWSSLRGEEWFNFSSMRGAEWFNFSSMRGAEWFDFSSVQEVKWFDLSSLRGAKRRGNPAAVPTHTLDCRASLAMTEKTCVQCRKKAVRNDGKNLRAMTKKYSLGMTK